MRRRQVADWRREAVCHQCHTPINPWESRRVSAHRDGLPTGTAYLVCSVRCGLEWEADRHDEEEEENRWVGERPAPLPDTGREATTSSGNGRMRRLPSGKRRATKYARTG